MVHRDVKTENVLLSSRFDVKLADFGLACLTSDEEQMARRCGSPGYVSPEIISANAYTCNTDCFSAGVILYFILRLKMPFLGSNLASIMRRTLDCKPKYEGAWIECVSDDAREAMKKLL